MTADCQSSSNRIFAIGSMCPTRGRALRYCTRLRIVRNLAQQVIDFDELATRSALDAKILFGISVHCLRQALRHLAFASYVNKPYNLDGLSRFYTTQSYGAYVLNMMEAYNPGAYPLALERSSVRNQKAPLTQYIESLQARYDTCLTPRAFIWSWKICCLAINSLDIRNVWIDLSSNIRPRHIAIALLDLLDCHMVSLYSRGYTWIVMTQEANSHFVIIPLFNRFDTRLIDPSLRQTDAGRSYRMDTYYEPRDWPDAPPELTYWLTDKY